MRLFRYPGLDKRGTVLIFGRVTYARNLWRDIAYLLGHEGIAAQSRRQTTGARSARCCLDRRSMGWQFGYDVMRVAVEARNVPTAVHYLRAR
jgi:hypothetical protein